jgi:thiamine-monophosphate kinase
MQGKLDRSIIIEDPGELTLIERIRSLSSRISGQKVRLGIGDDCALLRTKPREEIAVTTDLSIAGRHFRLNWHPPASVGHRALARGLSDLAAMGARPVAAFLSLGVPRELTVTGGRRPAWIDGFFSGFLALAEATRTPLAGGDLAESPVAVADIVLVGTVPRGRALLRSGARPGDMLYVTGTLGGASQGLRRLGKLARNKKTPPSIPNAMRDSLAPHLYPQPRLAQGIWLREHKVATAAIDLSDGLSTDLAHLCAESGVAAEIDAAQLPVHPGASLEQALSGGEDYELLFTGAPKTKMPRSISGVPVTRIGRIFPLHGRSAQVTLLTDRGPQPLHASGWEHFSGSLL